MRRIGCVVALLVTMAACAGNPRAAPLPPRPPGQAFSTGVVMWPYAAQDVVGHYAAWRPWLRVPVNSAADVQWTLDVAGAQWRVLLLVETVDDELVQKIATFGYRSNVWVELCNECAFIHDVAEMRGFYTRSLATLGAAGYPVDSDDAHVVSGGVANIEDSTLAWMIDTLVGMPRGLIAGWHAYSHWPDHLAQLKQQLAGRACLMTEGWSINMPTRAQELSVAAQVRSDDRLIYDVGCSGAIFYQTNSGTGPQDDFGLRRQRDQSWRDAVEAALMEGAGQ